MKGKEDEKIHPKDEATFVSRVMLWWIFRLLWKGNTTPLQIDDLYSMQHEDNAKYLTKRLQRKWNDEKSRALKSKRKPVLWKALLRFFTWKDYGFLVSVGSVFLIAENVVWYCAIKLLYLVGLKLHEGIPEQRCFVYIYGIAIGQLCKVITANHFHLSGAVLGIQARAAVVGLLYKKVLSVSKASLPTGHVMELISDDSQRLVTSGEWFIQDIVRRILSCICAFIWLFYFVGWQVAPGSLLLISLGFYRFLVANIDYKLRTGTSRLADKRLGYIREMLTGIHSVKMNCLEEIYEQKIRHTRWHEIKFKAKRWMIIASFYPLLSSGQQLATFVSIMLLHFTDSSKISYETVFAIMSLISEVCAVFSISLPTATRLAIDVYKSLQRIQDFLESDDHVREIREKHSPGRKDISEKSQLIDLETRNDDQQFLELKELKPNDTKVIPGKPCVSLHDVTCKLPSLHTSSIEPHTRIAPLLNYVTLDISEPGLVIITGPVGSGKSSLLACVLDGELLVTNGIVTHSGNLAYVSDTPWVFSGTIRENILFGLVFDEQRYLKTIKACQLEMDFNDFPQGDLSRIGEHGATVSCGQRVRIALARAVYSQADIYLLDDPLSSLDAQVAENIFTHCIRGLLADRIVLLTTNNSRYLSKANYMVKLERGIIVSQGKFQTTNNEVTEMAPARRPRLLKSQKSFSIENLTAIPEDSEDSEPMAKILREEEEYREIGMVPFKVYREYFTYGAPVLVLLLVALVYLFGQVLVVLVDIQVSQLPFLTKHNSDSQEVFIIYSLLLLIAILLVIFATYCLLLVPMNAAYALHNAMTTSVIKAPLSFHSTNPVGRIMNRFSQDINNLDELLPNYFLIFSLLLPSSIATVVLASVTETFLIPFGLISFFAFFFTSKFYFSSAVELRRLMALARSHLYSHFSNTIEGAPTIRVYKKQKQFTDKVYSYIDGHNKALFAYYTSVRWFVNTLDIVSVVFSTIIVAMVVYSAPPSANAAITTIAIFYAINTVQVITYAVRLFAEIQSQMTSVQRVLAYTKIEPEKGRNLRSDAPQEWPHSGSIQFKNVSVRHYEDGPNILKNLSFEVNASEKIGIAGRTGAGKSSLVAALMRMAETDGEIIVDNINIMKLNVFSSRRNISIISQFPMLISNSIRVNLDPFKMFKDSEIWEALDQMQMKTIISSLPQQLESEIISSSSGFSVGEKQLFHLARVLLRKSKIIVFDEATGKVDETTDEIIQRVIRDVFRDCTVITIAHRLSTILDCDRIMVLDRGAIVEFDKPEVLLEKEDGVLKQLYKVSAGN